MPAVSGLGTTFNLPNYTGEVLTITPSETPFLSAIGGLNGGGESVSSTRFEWQTQDLGTPAQPSNLEGADAPTLGERSRGNVDNIVQIFQYAFGVSYTRQAATQSLAGLAIGQQNPITDEVAYQTGIKLTEAARDINYSLLLGAYNSPSDNTTARRTRGLMTAITTNAVSKLGSGVSITATASADTVTWTGHGLKVGDVVQFSALTGGAGLATATPYYVVTVVDANTIQLGTRPGGSVIDITTNATGGTAAAGAALTKAFVLDMLQGVWDSHGINTAAEPTLIVNATLKRSLTKLFITDANYQEMTRNVGGVALTRVETDFGGINIMLERNMPAHTLGFAHLGMCMPMYLLIPGKGFLFTEALAKTGATERYQLYGEIGLKYGAESAHAKLTLVSPASGY